jgi:hypothetical protein
MNDFMYFLPLISSPGELGNKIMSPPEVSYFWLKVVMVKSTIVGRLLAAEWLIAAGRPGNLPER